MEGPQGEAARVEPKKGLTCFLEDSAVCKLAEETGLTLSRYEAVEVTDLAALEKAGLMKQSPDFARIRKAILAGTEIQGARLSGSIEYKLRRSE